MLKAEQAVTANPLERITNIPTYIGAIIVRRNRGGLEVLTSKYGNKDIVETHYGRLPAEPNCSPYDIKSIMRWSLAEKLAMRPSDIRFNVNNFIFFHKKGKPFVFIIGKLKKDIPDKILNKWHPTRSTSWRKIEWKSIEDALRTLPKHHVMAMQYFKTLHLQVKQASNN